MLHQPGIINIHQVASGAQSSSKKPLKMSDLIDIEIKNPQLRRLRNIRPNNDKLCGDKKISPLLLSTPFDTSANTKLSTIIQPKKKKKLSTLKKMVIAQRMSCRANLNLAKANSQRQLNILTNTIIEEPIDKGNKNIQIGYDIIANNDDNIKNNNNDNNYAENHHQNNLISYEENVVNTHVNANHCTYQNSEAGETNTERSRTSMLNSFDYFRVFKPKSKPCRRRYKNKKKDENLVTLTEFFGNIKGAAKKTYGHTSKPLLPGSTGKINGNKALNLEAVGSVSTKKQNETIVNNSSQTFDKSKFLTHSTLDINGINTNRVDISKDAQNLTAFHKFAYNQSMYRTFATLITDSPLLSLENIQLIKTYIQFKVTYLGVGFNLFCNNLGAFDERILLHNTKSNNHVNCKDNNFYELALLHNLLSSLSIENEMDRFASFSSMNPSHFNYSNTSNVQINDEIYNNNVCNDSKHANSNLLFPSSSTEDSENSISAVYNNHPNNNILKKNTNLCHDYNYGDFIEKIYHLADRVHEEVHPKSKKFREYCDHYWDSQVEEKTVKFAQTLTNFTAKKLNEAVQQNKIQTVKKRMVFGFRDILKAIYLKKIKCVIVATDLEDSSGLKSLNETVFTLVESCRLFKIPVIFGAQRKRLPNFLVDLKSLPTYNAAKIEAVSKNNSHPTNNSQSSTNYNNIGSNHTTENSKLHNQNNSLTYNRNDMCPYKNSASKHKNPKFKRRIIVSAIGIMNYEGAERNYKDLVSYVNTQRQEYLNKFFDHLIQKIFENKVV